MKVPLRGLPRGRHRLEVHVLGRDRELGRLGDAALPALVQAVRGSDPEVAARAQAAIRAIRNP